jgi:hypothetical protein
MRSKLPHLTITRHLKSAQALLMIDVYSCRLRLFWISYDVKSLLNRLSHRHGHVYTMLE